MKDLNKSDALNKKVEELDKRLEFFKKTVTDLESARKMLTSEVKEDGKAAERLLKMNLDDLAAFCSQDTLDKQQKNYRELERLFAISLGGLLTSSAIAMGLNVAGLESSIAGEISGLVSAVGIYATMVTGAMVAFEKYRFRNLKKTKKHWNDESVLKDSLKNRYLNRFDWLKKNQKKLEPELSVNMSKGLEEK